jgi:DNA-binding PadR family transcriptional regulator
MDLETEDRKDLDIPIDINFLLINVRGLFKDLVLYAIAKLGKAHGYAIRKFIKDLIKVYTPSSGILYPTLHELEKEGLLKSFTEKNKKVYILTEKGVEYIKNRIENIERTVKKLDKAMSILSYVGLKDLFNIIKELWDNDIEPSPDMLEIIKSKVSEIISILNNLLKNNLEYHRACNDLK